MHPGLAVQRAWDLLLLRAPTAALAAAADHHTVAGWIALAATPAGCPLPATRQLHKGALCRLSGAPFRTRAARTAFFVCARLSWPVMPSLGWLPVAIVMHAPCTLSRPLIRAPGAPL